jgi:hypothetical protein
MYDRRQHRRVSLARPIWVQQGSRYDESKLAFDVGEGGLRMERLGVAVDAQLQLVLPLPAGQRRGCLVRGRVVWKRMHATGIQFVDPSAEALRAIREHVEATG